MNEKAPANNMVVAIVLGIMLLGFVQLCRCVAFADNAALEISRAAR